MGKLEKSFFWLCFVVGIYAIVGFKLIPIILKDQIIKNLDENLTQKATIGKIQFNPFNISAIIHDFKISDTNEELFLVSVYFTNKDSQDIFENNYSFLLNGLAPISLEKIEKDNENFKSLMLKNNWGKYYLVKFTSQDVYNLTIQLKDQGANSAQLNFEK